MGEHLGDAGPVPDWRNEEPSDAQMTPRRLAHVWLVAELAEPQLELEGPTSEP